jgi:AAA+ superfamily predicted ATPase
MTREEALIAALRRALEATPDSAPLHQHLADLLVQQQAFEEAAALYRRALDLDPDNTQIKMSLAQTYYRQRRPDVALVIVEQLEREGRASPEMLLLAARCYLETGEQQEAARAYQQGVSLDATLVDPQLESRLSLDVLPPTSHEPPSAPPQTTSPEKGLLFVTAGEEEGELAADIERPVISFKDVGGMELLKEEIRMKIIYPLNHPELYEAYGKKLGGGILMYGPPGCGKTYLARATAGEVEAAFLAIGLHDVLDMYIGQSERNLHALFETARRHAPCVLFFDEVDALGAKRADLRHSAMRQVINQFLSELDGVDTTNEGVLILAATNAPWHLDTALRRPGRFDRVLFVPPPDLQARAAILQILLAGKPTEQIDYARVARQTEGFSGADLRGVVDRAVEEKLREALRTGRPAPLSTRDLLACAKGLHPSTPEWFGTARNYAIYANQSGLYNEILDYLNRTGRKSFFN